MKCKDKYSKIINSIMERDMRRRGVGGETKGTLQMIRKAEEVREALGRVGDLLVDVSRLIDEYNEHPMFGEYLVTVDERAEVECAFMRHTVEYMQEVLERLPDLVTVKALKERLGEDEEDDLDDLEEDDEIEDEIDDEEAEASCDCNGHCKDCCPGDDDEDDDWCAVIYFDGEDEDEEEDLIDRRTGEIFWTYEPEMDTRVKDMTEELLESWKRNKALEAENDKRVLLKKCLDLIEKLTKDIKENKGISGSSGEGEEGGESGENATTAKPATKRVKGSRNNRQKK